MTDWDLLERFKDTRCDRAFGDLVSRHAGFVYATCLRRLRDPHLAEDVTQAVFVLLARRPPARRHESVLSGWLYQTAIYESNNAMRRERLRKRHEQEAIEQRDRLIAQSAPAVSIEVEAQLDEAMSSLSSADRDVLLLRYYESLDLREIGSRLGLSETAASKRATRALARLKDAFTGAGSAISAASASAMLPDVLRQPAPPGLVERSARRALSAVPVASGVMQIMLHAKAKLVAAAIAITIVVVGGATLSFSLPRAQPSPATTQPAHQSTPMDTLREFIQAFRQYDATAVRSLVVAADDRGRRMSDAMCEYVQAAHDIRKALTDKFGGDVIEQLPELGQLSELDSVTLIDDQMLAQFQELIEDGVATLRPPDPQFDDFILVLQDGTWKISGDRMTSTWTAPQTDERVGRTRELTVAVRLLTKQIESGDFQSVDAFREALEPLQGR